MVCNRRFALAVLAAAVPVLSASSSRPARPLVAAAWARTRDVRASLNEVLDEALGKGHKADDVHVDALQEKLRPIYAALPKNGKGLLGHATVRYALHRHFVHYHGLYVKGLEPAGEAWNSSSPIDILEDKVPSYIQQMFEERLHDGFDLKELALFAATLEHFMHVEAMERLHLSYRLTGNGEGFGGLINPYQLEKVIDAYMVLLLHDTAPSTEEEMRSLVKDFSGFLAAWPDTQVFLREVQDEVLESEHVGETGPVTFQLASKVIEVASDRYGKHQDAECRVISKLLASKDSRGTGRIGLSDFYMAGQQFRESKELLERLGVTEEGPSGTSVIIPNYVISMPNCISSTSLFSICCLDPCESVLRHLEAQIKAPTATPEELVKLVATTPSDSVQVPRSLSGTLVQHLSEIAEKNKGRVPLHGRLFSQWLHQAYPHECPYPVKSGTTSPKTADAWLESQNISRTISDEDLGLIFEQAAVKVKDLADGDMESTLPWDDEEELVYQRPGPSMAEELRVILRALALVAALFGLALSIAVSASALLRGGRSKSNAGLIC